MDDWLEAHAYPTRTVHYSAVPHAGRTKPLRQHARTVAAKERRQKKRKMNDLKTEGRPRSTFSRFNVNPQPLPVDYNVSRLATAKGGWVSLRQTPTSEEEWTLEKVVQHGFRIFPWDGMYVFFGVSFRCVVLKPNRSSRNPFVILDEEGRVMTALAGRPGCKDWTDVHTRMSKLLEEAADSVMAPQGGRRGNYVALTSGVSHGGGRRVRMPCKFTAGHAC